MKYKLLFAITLLSSTAFAQFNCGTSEAQESLYKKYPELLVKQKQADEYAIDYTQQHYGEKTNIIYTIPIVFHIIHNYGTENISDAQIMDAIRILNQDYNKLNPDTNVVIAPFKPIIGNIGIKFKLAHIDNNGNCTNGIDRIVSYQTYVGTDQSKLNPWDRSKYLNIWVVKQIQNGAAGYAYYPAAVDGVSYPVDGVLILSNYIGSIGTSSPTTSRALTHEIGHVLNLQHTWGNTNNPGVACGDDGVSDTPKTKGWSNCPASTAPYYMQWVHCSLPYDTIPENVQNYMDYSYCTHMFTEGQKQRMLAALNSNVSHRNNLWQPSNVVATGVYDSTSICMPIADFYTTQIMICAGNTATFKNNTHNAVVDSLHWSFPGGTPSYSSATSPVVTYPNAGNYLVTLTSINSAGTTTITKDNYIHVAPPYSTFSGTYSEDFEDYNEVNTNWTILNPENNYLQWQYTTDAGYNSNSSMYINNYYNETGDVDAFISPPIDLRYMTNMSLNFKYSAASMNTIPHTFGEHLRVFISHDCGATWATHLHLDSANIYTVPYTPTEFYPANTSQWKDTSIALSTALQLNNVLFKFEFTSGDIGNNVFIDDINITGVLGTEQGTISKTINLFPNPTDNNFEVKYTTTNKTTYQLEITDVTGNLILHKEGNFMIGENKINIDISSFQKGIYFVNLINGTGNNYRSKIVKE